MSRALAGRILAVGGLAALSLVGTVAWEARARAGGTEVRMAMEAVDPRSLLSGHYAELQLIDRLPAGLPCPQGTDRRGGSWLVLRRAGDRDRVAGAFASRADAERFGRGAVVRGTAECRSPEFGMVRADLGVERFHAEQGEAMAIESALRRAADGERPEAYAVLSIGRDGRARVKGVVVDGRRIDLDWF